MFHTFRYPYRVKRGNEVAQHLSHYPSDELVAEHLRGEAVLEQQSAPHVWVRFVPAVQKEAQ